MKALSDWFDRIMGAITFAEAGEFETARQMMGNNADSPSELSWVEKMSAAVALSEGGLHDDALVLADLSAKSSKRTELSTDRLSKLGWVERMGAAVALAEGGLHDEAMMLAEGRLHNSKRINLNEFLQDVGLVSAHVRLVVIRTGAQAV